MARLSSLSWIAPILSLTATAALAEPPAVPAPTPAPGPSAAPAPSPARSPSPSPSAPACGVRIARAPEGLRAIVEAQLAADEKACKGALDVWLIPTREGIYVQARDPLGRLRERVVASPEIAATLIASWVEVDTAAPVWTAPEPAAAAAPPTPAPALVPAATTAAAAPVVAVPSAQAPALEASTRPERPRLSIGSRAVYVHSGTGMDGVGLRLDGDVVTLGNWHLGVAAFASAFGRADDWFDDSNTDGKKVCEMSRKAGELLGSAHYVWQLGSLALIPSAGLGLGLTSHQLDVVEGDSAYQATAFSYGPRFEMSLTGELAIAQNWHVGIGVANGATFYIPTGSASTKPPVWMDSFAAVLAGLRYQR